MQGKQHKITFPTNQAKSAREPLDLVHSEKLSEKTLSGAENLLTFIVDKTRYICMGVYSQEENRRIHNGNQSILIGYGTETKGYRLQDSSMERYSTVEM